MNNNQIIESFKSDAAFAEKYSALISAAAILEQSKTDGFDVSKEDVEAHFNDCGGSCDSCGKLREEELAE